MWPLTPFSAHLKECDWMLKAVGESDGEDAAGESDGEVVVRISTMK